MLCFIVWHLRNFYNLELCTMKNLKWMEVTHCILPSHLAFFSLSFPFFHPSFLLYLLSFYIEGDRFLWHGMWQRRIRLILQQANQFWEMEWTEYPIIDPRDPWLNSVLIKRSINKNILGRMRKDWIWTVRDYYCVTLLSVRILLYYNRRKFSLLQETC